MNLAYCYTLESYTCLFKNVANCILHIRKSGKSEIISF